MASSGLINSEPQMLTLFIIGHYISEIVLTIDKKSPHININKTMYNISVTIHY